MNSEEIKKLVNEALNTEESRERQGKDKNIAIIKKQLREIEEKLEENQKLGQICRKLHDSMNGDKDNSIEGRYQNLLLKYGEAKNKMEEMFIKEVKELIGEE